MEAEDLAKALRKIGKKLGVDTSEFEEALKRLDKNATPDEIAKAIGKAIGNLAGGMAAGATGVDPALTGKIIDALAPAASSALDKIIEEILKGSDDFKIRKVKPLAYKREGIRRPKKTNPFDWEDDQAPDIDFSGTLVPECGDANHFHLLVKGRVKYREEEIEDISVTAYDRTGEPIARYDPENGIDDPRSSRHPEKAIEKANDDKGRFVPFQTTLIIPCDIALRAGGHLAVQITVTDEDGNFMTVFQKVSFTHLLLDPNTECCNLFKIKEFQKALRDLIESELKKPGISMDAIIRKLMEPIQDAKKPTTARTVFEIPGQPAEPASATGGGPSLPDGGAQR